jgi:hypothetical protein
LKSFSQTKSAISKLDPDPYSDYSSDSAFRILRKHLISNVPYLFARGRLERYEELGTVRYLFARGRLERYEELGTVRYLFARGRLERYEELKDGMLEGGVGTQDERQVSWQHMAIKLCSSADQTSCNCAT